MDSKLKEKYRLLSVYQKAYVGPGNKFAPKVKLKQEFKDPIAAGFKKFLLLDEKDISLPYEDGEFYMEKCKTKPTLAKILKYPLDKTALFKNQVRENLTSEYKLNYCDIEKDIQYYWEKRNQKLPQEVNSDIPLTTYLTHFRFAKFLSRDVMQSDPYIPKPNLHTTGDLVCHPVSEYEAGIGYVGGLISESMHAKRH